MGQSRWWIVMDQIKTRKDLMSIYMFRNAFATFFITFLAFSISLMSFYETNIAEALQRLFINDIYTTLYFLLVWVFDYLVFETSKIIYDMYEEKVTFLPCIVAIILCVLIFFIPLLDLFQYNFCFLLLLICLRMIKEMYKRTPQLFKFLSFKKKRPENGLK